MLSCDYNGWNDMPEDEREWVDEYVDEYLESPSELTGDFALQFTSMEKTSRPLPDWSTCTMASRAGPDWGMSSLA